MNGIINNVNIWLKNGVFIEILFRFNFLCIRGSSVFNNIISVVVYKNILLFINNILWENVW